MKQATTTTIGNKLNLEGVDLELRQTTTVKKRKKNVSKCIILLEDVPIIHNFNHKGVVEQDEKKLRTKNNSEEDSSVKKRKKVVAR